MIELALGKATPTIRALFPTEGPTYRRCISVLDGSAGGRILTDDPIAPGWAAVVLELSEDSTLFLAGSLSRDLVAELIRILRREREVVVGLTPNDPLLALLPPDPDYDGTAIDFDDRAPEVDLERLIAPPVGFRLMRVDQELAPRCAWGPWMMASLDAALEHGLGYCLLNGDLVVAEGFAGPNVGGELEIGTITHQDYRHRGLGTVVCARTILECERLGFRVWWNTSLQNVASAGLARKLGYRTERSYRVLAWFKASAT